MPSEVMEDVMVAARRYVRQYMGQYDSSHDFEHIRRVLRLAKQIEAKESVVGADTSLDSTIITLASLMHDVGDKKYLKPGEDSSTMVEGLLKQFGCPEQTAAKVQTIVTHVSYSFEINDPEKVKKVIAEYPELAVVQDADRLDAIGAVGIGRCFTFSAAKSRQGSMQNAIQHFQDKLEKLGGMMKTKTGAQLAAERTEKIKIFEEWWREECA